MRTEEEMMSLILSTAEKDERIRSVYMNGSRTNPNVPKDIFQDYDVVYVVTETESFIKDKTWIDVFGEKLIMQLPDELDKIHGHEYDFENCYGYLMQFKDGNRIDLHLKTFQSALIEIMEEKLTVILLDKDNMLPEIPKPTDEDYWVQKPTEALFMRCCNEFWWLLNNIAKGLWREEIPYAMDNLNFWLRPELKTMISWYAGILTDFSCSVGKCGKYLYKYIPKDMWEKYLSTYPSGDVISIWQSVFAACELFQEVSIEVSKKFIFSYNFEEVHNSIFFLKHVNELSKEAKEVL